MGAEGRVAQEGEIGAGVWHPREPEPSFPGWRKGERWRVPGGDGVGESVLKDESLDHFLDLTFLFLFLFLPQMNWVSITGQVWAGGGAVRGEEYKCPQCGIWAFLAVGQGEGRSVTSRTVGGF